MLQARIPDDLLASLDKAAAQNGRSRSLEAQVRLKESFDLPAKLQESFGPPEVRYLAQLIARLVSGVQNSVGAPLFQEAGDLAWHRNPFTYAAVRTAINILLAHFRPEGAIETPSYVKRLAEFVEPERADAVTSPEGVGEMRALSLIDQLAIHRQQPSAKNIIEGGHYGENYLLFPKIGSIFGGSK